MDLINIIQRAPHILLFLSAQPHCFPYLTFSLVLMHVESQVFYACTRTCLHKDLHGSAVVSACETKLCHMRSYQKLPTSIIFCMMQHGCYYLNSFSLTLLNAALSSEFNVYLCCCLFGIRAGSQETKLCHIRTSIMLCVRYGPLLL